LFHEVVGLQYDVVLGFVSHQKSELEQSGPGRSVVLSPRDEILLLLIHLKHTPFDSLLGAMFQVSRQTAANTWKWMLDVFYEWLKSRLTFQTLEWRLSKSFVIFHQRYTIGIDDFEQELYRPSNPQKDLAYYSVKKGYHSLNYFVVAHLFTKRVLYIKCCPGGKKDSQIAMETAPEWYTQLGSSEYGLGDKIFNELNSAGMRIDTPPSRRNELYKVIAGIRCYVENSITNLKNWNCLRTHMRTV
jgi:hypothetical protein